MKTLENVVVLSLEDYEQLMKNQKTEELEVGKWYWVDRSKMTPNDTKSLVVYQGQGISTYGFNHKDKFISRYGLSNTFCNPIYVYTKATHEEVEQALIKEAEKRYKVGDKVMCIAHNEELVIQNLHLTKQYLPDYNRLWYGQNRNKAVVVFQDGKWAEIITEPKIDYDRLKTGSVVMVSNNGDQIFFDIDHNYPCTILNIDSGYIIDRIGQLSKSNYKHTLNLIQEGAKLACCATSSKPTYITEVISY